MMKDYQDFFTRIGFKIDSLKLLQEAFTHRSAVNEKARYTVHNERLEFLGDAVLELVTTDYLFRHLPDKAEGDLTNIRSALVRGDHLAQVARYLEVGKYLILSKGEERSGGAQKDYLLANLVEALIGAIYLDKGIEVAREFIDRFIIRDLDEILEKKDYIDIKSSFQEFAQEKLGITPHYKLYDEKGQDHNKIFTVDAFVGDQAVGRGKGHSKKEAQAQAATQAMKTKETWLSLGSSSL